MLSPTDSSPPFTIPRRFHPGWSLLGRLLRRRTGDRLRAESLHLALLTGGALVWLMGVYAAGALVSGTGAPPLVVWSGLGAAGGLLVLGGVVGVQPRAVVRCGPAAMRVERGRERVRLPYAALERVETVGARVYHRRYRRWAAVRPFLNGGGGPVLLVHMRDRRSVVALALPEAQRTALRQRLEARRKNISSGGAAHAPPPDDALEAARG